MAKIYKLSSKIDTVQDLGGVLSTILRELPLNEEKYYDNADVKRLLHVSDATLYRMRVAGSIPFVKFGKKIFYPVSFFKYKPPDIEEG